jgi:hypothetical protein
MLIPQFSGHSMGAPPENTSSAGCDAKPIIAGFNSSGENEEACREKRIPAGRE